MSENYHKKITIAVDGHSSTGKSTLSKQLAEALGYIYVDSGAMYRAITFYAIENNLIGIDFFDVDELIKNLPKLSLEFKREKEWVKAHVFLNGKDIEREIRGLEVSNFVSRVAEIPEVRSKLVQQQKKMGQQKGVVMDGRDIGTVVFPDAELKIFMTATPEVRAQRRYAELLSMDEKVEFIEVLKNIEERDHLDSTRKDSPLVQAEDAVVVDNSNLDIHTQFQLILNMAQSIIANLA